MDFSDVPSTKVIFTVMQDIMDSITQVYQDEDVLLPDRCVYTVGDPAPHECEQVSIALGQLYIGGPGDQAEEPMRCNAPRTVTLTVQIVRCIPTPKARGASVDLDDQALSTESLACDYWMLMDGIMAAKSVDYLGALVDIEATPPNGGYQAVQANIVVAVP